MKNSFWSVVTIQEEDGHELDGIFITNCEKTLKKFAKSLSPWIVNHSKYETEKDAKEFFFEICDGFMNIEPNRYIGQRLLHKSLSLSSI